MIERVLYNLILPAGIFGYQLYGLFNEKAKRTFALRKGLFKNLSAEVGALGEGKRVLIHISSVGEYLQARPIARLIRQNFPELKVCLSLFSPSAEGIANKGAEADLVTYLPLDRKKEMKKFLELLNPSLVIFSCYDLWPNLIWLCKERGIKLALVNASLAENSGKLGRGVRWWFGRLYQELDLILAASEQDRRAILSLGVKEQKVIVTGNARFDETLARIQKLSPDDELLKLVQGYLKTRCVVFGSTWPEDDEVIIPALARLWEEGKDIKVIIAPHEVGARKVEKLRERFLSIGIRPVLLWELESRREGMPKDSRVIIINTVGKLYKLYKLAQVAFVGGSFKKEVHNVMEPAGFGVPVLFGPRIKNSLEAQRLVEQKGGFIVNDSEELYERLRFFLENEEQRLEAGKRAYQMVWENQGAGEKILKLLVKSFPEVFEDGGRGQ